MAQAPKLGDVTVILTRLRQPCASRSFFPLLSKTTARQVVTVVLCCRARGIPEKDMVQAFMHHLAFQKVFADEVGN